MFEDLLKSGRIRREKVSPAEIGRALERAQRDLMAKATEFVDLIRDRLAEER